VPSSPLPVGQHCASWPLIAEAGRVIPANNRTHTRRTGIFSVGSGHPPIRRKPFVGCVGSVLLAWLYWDRSERQLDSLTVIVCQTSLPTHVHPFSETRRPIMESDPCF
jgi:hypothetical protein